jgi:serine/threonine-protein kinase
VSAPVAPGDVLAGKYRVERVLGSGGMGIVVAARHMHLGERVAIKFLLPTALAHDEVVQRFLQEGRAAVRIRSEHVGRVFDVGTLESGSPYLVMEYLEGSDLGCVLQERGVLPVDVAVDYVLQASEAIAEAHSLGMVHRDLKPANLFVTNRADGSPVVKVIDFGISKVGAVGGDGEGGMTKSAVMMGSPLFMAPEQMASARDADARSDIWSLGVILHMLLTGAPPYLGDSALGIFEQIMKGPPSLRAARPEVPESLERIVQRCLTRDRGARPQSVADLAMALAPFAPPESRISIDRIVRVLRGRPDPSVPSAVLAGSLPPLEASPPAAQPASSAAMGGQEDSRFVQAPTAMDASLGGQARTPAPRSTAAVVGAGVAVAVVLGLVASVYLFGRAPAADSPALADPAPRESVAPSVPVLATSTPPPPPTSTDEPDAAAPPATAAPAASTGRPRTTSPKLPRSASAPTGPSGPTKPPTDPFADPR